MRTLARFVTSAHKAILVAWIIIFAVMAFFAIQLPNQLEGDGFRMDAEHERVMKIASETFDLPVETMFIVFEGVDDTTITETLRAVQAIKVTSAIDSPLENEAQYKEDISYAMLHFDNPDQDMSATVADIRDAIGDQKGITLTGQSAIAKDINSASQRDLMKAEAIGLPIAIIVLLFAFGTIVASLVPLAVGLATVISAFGILTWIGDRVDLSIFVLNIVPMLGLALSIDFALLFISRYREELQKGSEREAVFTTILTAGRSVIFSAFCVFIGLGAMFLIQVEIFQNIALGGMIVVSMAVLSSTTLLPAILLALGHRIHKGRLLKVKEGGSNRWRQFAQFVIKRPIRITLMAIVLLGIAVIPVKNMDLTIPQIDSLPTSYDTRAAYEQIDETFGLADQSTIYLVATRSEGWEEHAGLVAMKALDDELLNDSLVKEVNTIFSSAAIATVEEWEQLTQLPDMQAQLSAVWDAFVKEDQLLVPVTLAASGASDEAQDWVREWPEKHAEWDLLIGGQPKFNQEIFDEILDKIGYVLLVIIVSTFIILMLAFRSFIIPLKAIIMNVIGLSATFGILVYIFQYGHFGLTAGTIALIIPVIVFSLVFGLSMDYEVFLISRMQEEYAISQDNDLSTVEGLATTSKIITSAALIMIVLTGAFAFTDVLPVKQIGVGIAIAVAIDATIIRLLLVPSLMKLFGKWNWWLPFGLGLYRPNKK